MRGLLNGQSDSGFDLQCFIGQAQPAGFDAALGQEPEKRFRGHRIEHSPGENRGKTGDRPRVSYSSNKPLWPSADAAAVAAFLGLPPG